MYREFRIEEIYWFIFRISWHFFSLKNMLKEENRTTDTKISFSAICFWFWCFFLFHEVAIFRFYPRNLFFLFSKAISTLEILCHPIIIRNNLKKYMPRQAPITQRAVVAIVKKKNF
jgi:hypothetical protein